MINRCSYFQRKTENRRSLGSLVTIGYVTPCDSSAWGDVINCEMCFCAASAEVWMCGCETINTLLGAQIWLWMWDCVSYMFMIVYMCKNFWIAHVGAQLEISMWMQHLWLTGWAAECRRETVLCIHTCKHACAFACAWNNNTWEYVCVCVRCLRGKV